CGSLHLATNARDWTFTSKICAMPGTLKKTSREEPFNRGFHFMRVSHFVSAAGMADRMQKKPAV
ncbi:hypothetical protein, partial [Faecalibaculum rodentium]|uniref:hypothetical protein n=1 Tax=Faecalibaculum rodentium TaxID=1702221 RepID=UPI001F5A7891